MTDAEMIALAALANIEAVLMQGENDNRKAHGYSAAWTDGCGLLPAGTALWDELGKRGMIK